MPGNVFVVAYSPIVIVDFKKSRKLTRLVKGVFQLDNLLS